MLPPPPQRAEELVRHCAWHAVPKALDTRKLGGMLLIEILRRLREFHVLT